MSERSSTSRRASQTRSSPASNRYIRGEDVSAAVMDMDRFDVDVDVNEVGEATSTHTGLERGEHPGEDRGVKAGAVSVFRPTFATLSARNAHSSVGHTINLDELRTVRISRASSMSGDQPNPNRGICPIQATHEFPVNRRNASAVPGGSGECRLNWVIEFATLLSTPFTTKYLDAVGAAADCAVTTAVKRPDRPSPWARTVKRDWERR